MTQRAQRPEPEVAEGNHGLKGRRQDVWSTRGSSLAPICGADHLPVLGLAGGGGVRRMPRVPTLPEAGS